MKTIKACKTYIIICTKQIRTCKTYKTYKTSFLHTNPSYKYINPVSDWEYNKLYETKSPRGFPI